MIVLDASAMVEALLGTEVGAGVAKILRSNDVALHAPHLLDVEVLHVLRRAARTGDIDEARGARAMADLAELGIVRHAPIDLWPRAWALRDNLSAYDAMYVALAEALDAPLLTTDRRLAGASGHGANIMLIG